MLKRSIDVPTSILAKVRHARPLLFLMVIALFYVILSYRGDGLTIGGDNLIPFHPVEYINRMFYDSNTLAGSSYPLPNIFSLLPLPDTILFALFSKIGLDIYLANKVYFFALTSLSAFSVYYLAVTIFRKYRYSKVIGIASSVAYLYNPWVYADTYKTMIFIEFALVQSGLILFIAFMIKYLQTIKDRYSILAGACTFLLLSYPGISAYRISFVVMSLFLLISIYYLVFLRPYTLLKNAKIIIKGALVAISIGFLLNAYWIVPFVQNYGIYSSYASEFQPTTAYNQYSNTLNTLRLMNSWSFYSGYSPYAAQYLTNPLLIAISFAWPFFAFSPLLFRESANRKVLCLYVVTLGTVFVSAGPKLYEDLFMSLINVQVGSFFIFRPFYNTGLFSHAILTLEFSILIGFFCSLVFSSLSRIASLPSKPRLTLATVSVVAICGLLVTSGWPLVTGEVMRNWYDPSQYGVRIPDSYWKANEYLEQITSADQRTILLPSTSVYVGTAWGYQGSSQFYNLLFNVPLVTGNEIPYISTFNKTSLNTIFSDYPRIVNGSLDIINLKEDIIAYQNDFAQADGSLSIEFMSEPSAGRWHQIELRMSHPISVSDFTHIIVELTGSINLSRLEFGVGYTDGYVGWWTVPEIYFSEQNGTFIPLKRESSLENSTLAVILDLGHVERSGFPIDNATSVWIQYFMTHSEPPVSLRIDDLDFARMFPNTNQYAHILQNLDIKYLLVDLSIKEGLEDSAQAWIDGLTNSQFFKKLWNEDSLFIFENLLK